MLIYKKNILILFIKRILVLLYLLLWFNALDNHDYYLINPIVLPLVIFISFFMLLKNNYQKIFKSKKLKIVLSFLLFFNIVYASNNLKMRHWNIMNINKEKILPITFKSEIAFWDYIRWGVNTNFYTIENFNRNLGIKSGDLVISLPDNSINISLYLMNQKGYNNFVDKLHDSTAIADRINLGAKYLFISDSSVYNNIHVLPFLKFPLGSYNNSISVFNLQPYKKNEY